MWVCACLTYVSQKLNKNPGNVNSNENIKWFSFKWLHHFVASEFHLQLPMLMLCVIHLRMSSSDFFIQSTTTTTHPFFYCCCCLWRTWHTPCANWTNASPTKSTCLLVALLLFLLRLFFFRSFWASFHVHNIGTAIRVALYHGVVHSAASFRLIFGRHNKKVADFSFHCTCGGPNKQSDQTLSSALCSESYALVLCWTSNQCVTVNQWMNTFILIASVKTVFFHDFAIV